PSLAASIRADAAPRSPTGAEVDPQDQHAVLDARLGVADDGVVLEVELGLADERRPLVAADRRQRPVLDRLRSVLEPLDHRRDVVVSGTAVVVAESLPASVSSAAVTVVVDRDSAVVVVASGASVVDVVEGASLVVVVSQPGAVGSSRQSTCAAAGPAPTRAPT